MSSSSVPSPLLIQYTPYKHPPHATPILYRPYISESLDMPSLSSLVGEGLSEPYSVYTYRYFLRRFQGACVLAFLDTKGEGEEEGADAHQDGIEGRPEGREREGECIGCIVCKVDDAEVSDDEDGADSDDDEGGEDQQQQQTQQRVSLAADADAPSCPIEFLPANGKYRIKQGYIGMLSVSPPYRRLGIGKRLISLALSVLARPPPLPRPTSDGVSSAAAPTTHRLSNYGYGCRRCVLEAELSNAAALKQYESFGFQRTSFLKSYYLNMGDALRLVLYMKDKSKGKNKRRGEPKGEEGAKAN